MSKDSGDDESEDSDVDAEPAYLQRSGDYKSSTETARDSTNELGDDTDERVRTLFEEMENLTMEGLLLDVSLGFCCWPTSLLLLLGTCRRRILKRSLMPRESLRRRSAWVGATL